MSGRPNESDDLLSGIASDAAPDGLQLDTTTASDGTAVDDLLSGIASDAAPDGPQGADAV